MPNEVITKKTVKVADLPGDDDIIDGYEFVGCEVVGPVVLAVLNDVKLISNTFDGDFDSILWPVPPERKRVIGAIGIRNCSFTGCTFRKVGMAGPPEFVKLFREGTASSPTLPRYRRQSR